MSQLVQPAKQDRSRKTQDRILQATSKLLETEPFESISVRRIIEEARTSIGSFYARFRDKEALLPVLYAEYEQQLGRRIRKLRVSTSQAESLEELARLIVKHLMEIGEVPNLSRALYEYATRAPHSAESSDLSKRRREQYRFLLDALLRFRDEITHDDPERAVELAVYFAAVTCRNRLLYPMAPHTRTLKLSKRELEAELVTLLTGYLVNPLAS